MCLGDGYVFESVKNMASYSCQNKWTQKINYIFILTLKNILKFIFMNDNLDKGVIKDNFYFKSNILDSE